jgi:RHS repeat-associated protein
VSKTNPSGTTVYVYDGQGELAVEYAPTAPASGTRYLIADALGTTRLVTGPTGAAVEFRDYAPFGEELPSGVGTRGGLYGAAGYPSTTANVMGPEFTGKERDAESGLDYFGARYYSGMQGRFTSADAPFADQHAEDPQSWNMYAYVRNNPLRYTDPDGRDCFRSVSSCAGFLAGVLKGAGNAATSGIVNAPNRLTNVLIAPFTNYRFGDIVPDTFQATNGDQREGMESFNGAMLVSPLAEAGAAAAVEVMGTATRVEAGTAAVTEVPTSIPAGPSARPTAAQQRAINQMGEAHGCSTCGATTPGTKTGNWVGDHQPPTALNPPGGSQVYQPQCLQCSRQQGGQVAAEARAAKKATTCTTDSNGTTTCK